MWAHPLTQCSVLTHGIKTLFFTRGVNSTSMSCRESIFSKHDSIFSTSHLHSIKTQGELLPSVKARCFLRLLSTLRGVHVVHRILGRTACDQRDSSRKTKPMNMQDIDCTSFQAPQQPLRHSRMTSLKREMAKTSKHVKAKRKWESFWFQSPLIGGFCRLFPE